MKNGDIRPSYEYDHLIPCNDSDLTNSIAFNPCLSISTFRQNKSTYITVIQLKGLKVHLKAYLNISNKMVLLIMNLKNPEI